MLSFLFTPYYTLFNGDGVSLEKDEKVVWMDDSNGYTTVRMYLMPLNCTVKTG